MSSLQMSFYFTGRNFRTTWYSPMNRRSNLLTAESFELQEGHEGITNKGGTKSGLGLPNGQRDSSDSLARREDKSSERTQRNKRNEEKRGKGQVTRQIGSDI